MSDFKELVKNLYTSKDRELTPEKFEYIQKTYSNGKEQEFVKNFYATIGEDLTEEKLTYISDTYLKKKDTLSQSSATQLPLPNQKINSVNQIGNALSGGVIQDFDETKVPKKENDYFKQVAVGIKPSAQGNVVERIYENPMGVEVLQIEPKKREAAPQQPVQKAESKDKPLKGVKPIAPTNLESNEQGWLLNMVSALDKGVYKTLGTTVQALGTGLQGVTSKITGGTGKGFVSDALIKLGSSYNEMIDDLTPQDESFKGSLSDQVGNALGYVAGLILTGGGSAAARTAGMSIAGKNAATVASQVPKTLPMAVKEAISSVVAPTGIVGGLGMGQAEFDRAKEAGATDDQAFEAFYKNAAMGSILEQIPVMHFLKRFNNATAGGVINYIKTKGVAGLTGGVEEMTTEMLQQLYANKTAKDIYNTNQDLFEGVVGNGTIGFSVGFLLNAMGANAKILRKEGKVNEAKLVENQVKELQEKAKGVAPTNNAITTKIAVNGNEEGLQRTQAELDSDLQKGLISEEEYQEKTAIAQKAAEVNAKIPDYVEGANRAESIELINEREALQQELLQKEEQKKGIDVAYHKVLDESNKEVQKRIDEINNQLGELAKPEKNKVEEVVVGEVTPPTDEQIADDLRNNRLVTFEYNSESEIPDVFKDKVSSKGENNGVEFFRVTLPESVANYELNKLNKQDKEVVAEEEMQQPIDFKNGLGNKVIDDVDFTAKGGNKVIDEQGEPIILLHGTNNDKIKFDEGTVFYATNDKQFADVYGENHLPVKISLKNPYDLTDSIDGIIKDNDGNPILDEKGVPYSINYIDEFVVKNLKSRGFDGVRVGNESVVAFDKSQVKEVEQPQREIVEAVRVEQEPETKEGVKVVTLSGMVEGDRVKAVEERKKKTTLTEKETLHNDLIDLANRADKARGNEKTNLQGQIRQRVRELNTKAGEEVYRYDGVAVRAKVKSKTKGERYLKIKGTTRDTSGRAIKEDAVLLFDRSPELVEKYEQLAESPNITALQVDSGNGVTMTAEQIEAALQDIADGIPSVQADNLLNALEDGVKNGYFDLRGEAIGQKRIQAPIEDFIGVQQEEVGQPLDEDGMVEWLNEIAELPQEEQIEIDNIILEYEQQPQQIDISGKVQSPKPESKEGSPTSPKPNQEGKGDGKPKTEISKQPIGEAEGKENVEYLLDNDDKKMVVYHGAKGGKIIENFDLDEAAKNRKQNRFELGIHFGTEENEMALSNTGGAKPQPYHLKFTRELDLGDEADRFFPITRFNVVGFLDILPKEVMDLLPKGKDAIREMLRGDYTKTIKDALLKSGYDLISYNNFAEDNGQRNYIALDPSQIEFAGKKEKIAEAKPKENVEQKQEPKKQVTEQNQKLADKIRAMKIDLSKLSDGGLQSNPLGLPVALWNTSMDIIAKAVEAGELVADAVKRGLNYIQKNHRGQWNKKQFNDEVLKELGLRGITVNGEDLIVKDDSKTVREFAETVNGFYSDIEQSILDVKKGNVTAKEWLGVIGSGDEAKFTGVKSWLESMPPNKVISKAEVQQWMKDNRIEIVEVVKSDEKFDFPDDKLKEMNNLLREEDLLGFDTIQEARAVIRDDENFGTNWDVQNERLIELGNEYRSTVKDFRKGTTKFSTYQLEGEKENYKEVLVTMPTNEKEIELSKIQDDLSKKIYDKKYSELTEKERAALDFKIQWDKDHSKVDFKSSHFDEPNILVHLRMNTRKDAEGNKVLFLEEVQSDWGQKGKREGFLQKDKLPNKTFIEYRQELYDKYGVGKYNDLMKVVTNTEKANIEAIYAKENQQESSLKTVSTAPFVMDTNDWAKLGWKVAIKEAVKQGVSKIAWTTGEQQNERYDLSKQVDQITYRKNSDGNYYLSATKGGNNVFSETNVPESKLADFFGKDVSERIVNNEGDNAQAGSKTLKGEQLSVGGKGMKGFYGSPSENKLGIVGEVAKSLFKQEPKTVNLKTDESKQNVGVRNTEDVKIYSKQGYSFYENGKKVDKNRAFELIEEGETLEARKEGESTQYSIDITPELKAEVEGGLPLFKDIKGRGKEIADLLRKGKIKIGGLQSNIAGIPIALYNTVIETIALGLEGGSTLAQAVSNAIKKHNLKNQKDYNQSEFIKALETTVGEKLTEQELDEAEMQGKKDDADQERRFTKQMLATESLLPKAEISKTLEYVKQSNALSIEQATKIIDEIGVDEAFGLVVSGSDMNGGVRGVLGQMLISKYNNLSKVAKTEADKEYYWDKTIEVADYVTKVLATEAGRMIQSFALWGRLTPEALIRSAIKDLQRQGEVFKKKAKKDVDNIGNKLAKANEEAIDEVLESNGLNAAIDNAEKKTKSKAAQKIKKIQDKRKSIIDKYKGKGGITFTSGGLTKEGIEFVGEMAKTYIEEGIANIQLMVEKIAENIKEISGKDATEDMLKQVKEIAEKKLSSSDIRLISKGLNDMKVKISEVVKKHFTEVENVKTTLAEKLVEEAGLEGEEATELANKIKDAFDRVATTKKNKILEDELERLKRAARKLNGTKEVTAKQLHDDIIRLTNLGGFNNTELLDLLAAKVGTGKLTQQEGARLQYLAERVRQAPEGSPKNDAIQDLLNYQANLKGSSTGELSQAVWYASLLGGYKTQIKNIVANFFNTAVLTFTNVVENPKATKEILGGLIRGWARGITEARHTLSTGKSPIHILKIEASNILERKRFKGKYNPMNVLKYVSRAMVAADVFAYQGLKESRSYQLAYAEAVKMKKKDALDESVWRIVNDKLLNTKERKVQAELIIQAEGLTGNEAKRRMYELMEQSRPEKMQDDSYNYAARGTYNYPPEGVLGALNNAISVVLDIPIAGVKPLRFLVPFTRVLTNVANGALDFEPITSTRRAIRGKVGFEAFNSFSPTKGTYREMTPEERKTQAVKAAIGVTALSLFYALSKMEDDEGEPLIEITGAGSSDYNKTNALKQRGWKPYSIKVGDKYYSYQLTPLILTLGWIGSLNDFEKYDAKDDAEVLEKMSQTAFRLQDIITDMSFMSSTADIFDNFFDNSRTRGKKVGDYFENLAKTSIPFMQPISQVSQTVQTYMGANQKETSKLGYDLVKDVPIARNYLYDKVNVLGEPIKLEKGIGELLVSTKKGSKAWDLLEKNGIFLAPIKRKTVVFYDTEKGMDLPATDEQFYNFSKERGAFIKYAIENLEKTGLPVIEKNRMIKKDWDELNSGKYKKEVDKYLEKIAELATKKAKEEVLFKKKTKIEKTDVEQDLADEMAERIENLEEKYNRKPKS